jgi:DNA-binding LytR/AlgR family response regulator
MDGNYYMIHDYLIFIGVFTIFFFLTVSIYLFGQNKKYKQRNTKLSETNKLIEQRLNEVQLEHIGTKLNPHLFKNILNSVQSHAYQTYMSLDKLANVLDYILYESNNKFVSPKEELTFALSLIEINKIKINPLFDFRIKSKIDKSDRIFEEKVFAPLISVDLIENAFKHTDFLAQDSFISIQLELQDGIYTMKVSNKASLKNILEKEKSGFGSQSLDQRLKMIYNNYYQLQKSSKNGIFTAELQINLGEFYDKILDDELLAISYLKLLCEQIENVEVVKAFNDPKIFLSEINSIDCNVCILDIEMPGMTGLQVAELISDSKKIIFTTAYKEYAAEAFDLNVVDYVRKPIKKERLIQAFEKAKELVASPQKKDFIEWNTNIGKTIIFTEQIAYIKTSEIDSRDKDIILNDGTNIVLKNLNFKNLLEMLPAKGFAQVNKKEIVALSAIKVFSTNEIITTIPTEDDNFLKLQIGDTYKSSLMEMFGK